jgi:hypothetical protein
MDEPIRASGYPWVNYPAAVSPDSVSEDYSENSVE